MMSLSRYHVRFPFGVMLPALLLGAPLSSCAKNPAATTDSGAPPDATAAKIVDPAAGPWPPSTAPTPPVSMDDVTVFAYSQSGTDSSDPQLLSLAPDISIRTWSQWDTYGTHAADFRASYVADCHAAKTIFMGGTVPTVVFRDQVASDAEFADFQTRDAGGNFVSHESVYPALRRGSLANPAYREYVIGLAKLQIDVGVDGVHFDEVNADYQGAAFDGNEGFDDYHLADFNAYLLAKYPPGTDFAALFGMRADNLLRSDVPAGDLVHNFNYRTYLGGLGLASEPLSSANPLAGEWGHPLSNRPAPGARTFVDTAEPYRYWRQIVDEVRAYARAQSGHEILISANGIMPFVDFQTVGIYYPNNDGPAGGSFVWQRLTADGHLDGTISWQSPLRAFKTASDALAPGAPVSVFMDGLWNIYDSLPVNEKQDFWRIYGAEVYANGLYMAFQLRTPFSIEPTAAQAGVMPLFASLSAFYRAHADLYHGITPVTGTAATVTISLGQAMVAVTDQATPRRRLVHIVNHAYRAGLVSQRNFTVTVSSGAVPLSATLISPDLSSDTMDLPFTIMNGQVQVVVPSLDAYDVIVLAY
jgi:hypothetical protein